MPVSLNSRYYGLPVFEAEDAAQQSYPTIAIRPNTPPPAGVTTYPHILTGVETLEYLAWRYYGSSAAWWRIAEANGLVFPLDFMPGQSIAIPSAGDVGRIERSRSF